MTLQAILVDFNGTIINDEPLHEQLLQDVLLSENLRPDPNEFREVCLGRSDRASLRELLGRRGRVVDDDYLDRLVARKSQAYLARLEQLPQLPIYPGVAEFCQRVRAMGLPMAIVTGAVLVEVETVLERAGLRSFFSAIISTTDQQLPSKPAPDGYLYAVDQLRSLTPLTDLQPQECLAIEDTYAGIDAARAAGMQVVGVATTYPFQVIHRRANWAVDFLSALDLDRVQRFFSGREREEPVNDATMSDTLIVSGN